METKGGASLKEGVMESVKCFSKMVLGRDWQRCTECGNWEASGDTGLRSERHRNQTAVSYGVRKSERGTENRG